MNYPGVYMILISICFIAYLIYQYKTMPSILPTGYIVVTKNGIKVRLVMIKGTYRGYVEEENIVNRNLYYHDEFGYYIDTKTDNNFKAEVIIKNNMFW